MEYIHLQVIITRKLSLKMKMENFNSAQKINKQDFLEEIN